MKRRILTLAITAAFGSLMLTACDRTEQKAAKAEADKRVDSPSPSPGGSSAPVALGQASTDAEKKADAPPVQGQVDPKEASQRADFEQKK